MQALQRSNELQTLEKIARSDKAELVYVRGRRRVGKSWLLKEFVNRSVKDRIIFAGSADAKTSITLKLFAALWGKFSHSNVLNNLRPDLISWPTIFEEIDNYALKNQCKLVLVFDEIQWIAREGSGFIGALKNAWVDWQRNQFIKVIICGSSNRFFQEHVGGEEKILRGLQTKPSLWIYPLSPKQVLKDCFPDWSMLEVTLTYMLLSGVPFYLERLNQNLSFIHAINQALFTKDENLLGEVDELLSLDFNKSGRVNVKKILSSLGQSGKTQQTIVLQTGLSRGTVSRIVNQLLDFNLIFEKFPIHQSPKANNEGVRYHMKDCYLNFYFQILEGLSQKILLNQKGLLFPLEVINSNVGYYIPNFSGLAFELFVRNYIEARVDWGSSIYEKLKIFDPTYEVSQYWNKDTQIDLIIESQVDRISRIIECKWGSWNSNWIKELLRKEYPAPKGYKVERFLVTSEIEIQSKLRSHKNLHIVSLEEFYS